MSSNHNDQAKLGLVQIIIFLGIFLTLTTFFYKKVIPLGVSGFVVPLFQPEAALREKKPWVEFNGNVYATVKGEAAKELGLSFKEVNGSPLFNQDGYKVNKDIKKSYIDKEFVFDMTFEPRTEEGNGYIKTTGEFYLRAPGLGEFPIMLEPMKAFSILAVVMGGVCTFIITLLFPASVGLFAFIFEEEISHIMVKIRLQTGLTDDIVDILTLPNDKLKDIDRDLAESVYRRVWERTMSEIEQNSKHTLTFDQRFNDDTDIVSFRNEEIYNRIKEFFSEFVESEIVDTRDGRDWKNNHYKIPAGLRLYLAHHFSEKYSNNVTGLAYAGAAILIIAVGVRGLKFIPANRPSYIFFAILLEFTLLSLMAVTIFYTEEEERMDKMLKKMEDANRSQLEALRGQSIDIHQLSTALVGHTSDVIKGRVENAISEYLTSGDQVQKQIATAIADKIVFDFKGDSPSHTSTARRK